MRRLSVILQILFICCLWAAGPAWAADSEQLTRAEVHDLYSQAKSLFQQANDAAAQHPEQAKALYARSAMYFERLVSAGGIQNGKLYYDIGNAYFRMGDLGRAILNYRRAQTFIPNDPNLKQNLAYARSQRPDKIEETQKAQLFKTLLFWHYDLSARTRSLIFGVCYALFWAGALAGLFYRRVPKGISMAAAGVGLLFLGSLGAEYIQSVRHRPGVVLAQEVIARKGDGMAYQPSFKEPLHEGIEFTLMEDRGGWYRVRLSDGRDCWIRSSAAELI